MVLKKYEFNCIHYNGRTITKEWEMFVVKNWKESYKLDDIRKFKNLLNRKSKWKPIVIEELSTNSEFEWRPNVLQLNWKEIRHDSFCYMDRVVRDIWSKEFWEHFNLYDQAIEYVESLYL